MEELTESRIYWSTLKIARLFPIPMSRNRFINTFIIVNIPPHVRDSSWDKSMVFRSKKGLTSSFSLAGNRIYLGTHLEEESNNLF